MAHMTHSKHRLELRMSDLIFLGTGLGSLLVLALYARALTRI